MNSLKGNFLISSNPYQFKSLSVRISTDLNFIDLESNKLENSQVLGASKEDTVEYVNFQKRLREIIEGLTLEKALEMGISRRTFFYLKKKSKNTQQIKMKEKVLKSICSLI